MCLFELFFHQSLGVYRWFPTFHQHIFSKQCFFPPENILSFKCSIFFPKLHKYSTWIHPTKAPCVGARAMVVILPKPVLSPRWRKLHDNEINGAMWGVQPVVNEEWLTRRWWDGWMSLGGAWMFQEVSKWVSSPPYKWAMKKPWLFTVYRGLYYPGI